MTPRTDDRPAHDDHFDARSGQAAPARPGALPPGPRWPALAAERRADAVPAPVRSRTLRRRYGDVFTMRLVPEGRPLVLFNRPERAKEIFAGDPEVFHAGKGNAILGPVMGEHSLLLVDGAQHKRARKLLMPAFRRRRCEATRRSSPGSPGRRSAAGAAARSSAAWSG